MPPQQYQYNNNNTIISNKMAGSGSPPRHAPPLLRLPGQVHHMAVMVSPNRVDYSVNKGGLKSWAVIIVFVLLCSAILNIFSEEGEDNFREENIGESLTTPEEGVESFNDEEETFEKNYHQKKKEENKGRADDAFGEVQEEEEDDENDGEDEEEDEEEEEEEEDEEKKEEEERINKNFKDEEELMLAKLGEKSTYSNNNKRKGKISNKIVEIKEDKQNEEKDETKNQVDDEKEEENEENAKHGEHFLLNMKEAKVHRINEDRIIHRRKVKSWRALQTQKIITLEKQLLQAEHDFVSAIEKYQKVLSIDRYSPRALYGRGRVYQLMAEFASDGDNKKLLEKAMADFEIILLQNDFDDIPDELYRISARYFVECARFKGGSQQLHKILQIQRALVDRFPDDLNLQCDLGATWLGMNRPEEASNILDVNPQHALAQAYYGYILKVYEGDLERGVNLMRRALRSSEASNVVKEQKFYFHLGEALTRLGRLKEAYLIYSDAVNYGLFPSVLQRSLHNIEHLTAHPWWTIEQIECSKQLRQLERHWTTIKEEAVQVWQNHQHLFQSDNYSGQLIEKDGTGHWILILQNKSDDNLLREEICKQMPYTCQMLKEGGFTDSVCSRENYCKRSGRLFNLLYSNKLSGKYFLKIRISVLRSGVSTWPHCGQTNYVLEGHLGLITHSDARIRVGNETRGWRQGKMLIYDSSFEHEIIFEGAPANALRIALILELWHPEKNVIFTDNIKYKTHQLQMIFQVLNYNNYLLPFFAVLDFLLFSSNSVSSTFSRFKSSFNSKISFTSFPSSFSPIILSSSLAKVSEAVD
ncbi:Asp_Arg_Hydrox domain-containing protein [Meloidogyne graminicola]|uniref:Asp_Arg_Hydrox domain-containing protein n=1 Tax=Meloidogyne graminicola TaxID=189291 RepID=A0A8S9ZIA7_9BILA|nr:Asp_Arg_Hydrox domain-containing protein [Meloidogyne graminicola]